MMELEEILLLNHIFDELGEAEEEMANVHHRRYFTRESAFDLSDRLFIKLFRLNKELVRRIINVISPYMEQPSRASALSIELKVLIALHFYGHGSYQECVGKLLCTGVSQSSVSRAITEVSTALNNVIEQFVTFPQNIEELRQLKNRFYRKYQFPGVIGCVDGTHVALVKPSQEEHIYVNRKNYHSLNVQLVCDENLKILNVNARFPGSCHDSYIWRQSQVSHVLENIYRRTNEAFFVLGDSGYPLRPWILTPFENPHPGTSQERCNNRLVSIRSLIERCNGVVKNRFRCLLRHRVLHYQPEAAAKIVHACVILHNLCIDNNIPEPDDADVIHMDFGLDGDNNVNENMNRVNPDLVLGRQLRDVIARNHFD